MRKLPGVWQVPVSQGKALIGFLGGPTASGKSALAAAAARGEGWAIVSADSMQVYRGMRAGTGIIPEEERHGVPHHLLEIADPGEEFHAARFVTEATAAIDREWSENGRQSLVAGGTGMWIQALREGLFDGPGRSEAIRASLRQQLDAEGPDVLHADLAAVDPPMADRLSPKDTVRVIRALEVFLLSGKPLSVWYEEDRRRRESLGKLPPLVVVRIPREQLHERIARRVDSMLAAGWLEEARQLRALDLPPHSPARKALGYPELFRVLDGSLTLEEARERIILSTAQFARRQMTWFRGQKDVQWLDEPTPEKLLRLLRAE